MSGSKSGMSPTDMIGGFMQGMQDMAARAQGAGAQQESPWWKSFHFPETPKFDPDKLVNCARSALFGIALNGGPPVRETKWKEECSLPLKDVLTRVIRYVNQELDGRLVYNWCSGTSDHFFFVFSGGAILVDLHPGPATDVIGVHIIGTSKAHMQLGEDLIKTCAQKEQNE